jgi:predicted nucleic acid-binding protein
MPTTGTTQLPLLLILDANVIIAAHESGVWDRIVETHDIFIRSVVIDEEVYFYKKPDGTRIPIDLKSEAGKSINEVSCTVEESISFSEQLLNTAMKNLILKDCWVTKRMKAIRLHLINLAGRVMERSRQHFIRLAGNHPSFDVLLLARQRIMELAHVPSG